MQRSLRPLLALALATLAGAASAQAFGTGMRPYAGASLGYPDWRDSNAAGVTAGSDRGVGGKLYGGWQFTPQLGVELGYANLGRLSGNGGRARGDGLFVDAVGTLPLNQQWSLLGRVGAFNGKLRGPAGSDRATNLKLGAGVQYALNRNTSIRAEVERYRFNDFGGHVNNHLYSVGLNWAF